MVFFCQTEAEDEENKVEDEENEVEHWENALPPLPPLPLPPLPCYFNVNAAIYMIFSK